MKRWLQKLKCTIIGHDFDVVDVSCTGNVEKIACKRCGRYYGINHSVKCVLRWDQEMEQCFASCNDRHSKYWPKNRRWLT
jgi:hypothetical protein